MQTLWLSPLFTGLTRPAMTLGVTLDYLAIAAMLTLCAVILGNSPLYGLVYLPLHVMGWVACRYDPFIFSLLLRKAECAYCPNKTVWGCHSYEPF